jgi:hypothetical protein
LRADKQEKSSAFTQGLDGFPRDLLEPGYHRHEHSRPASLKGIWKPGSWSHLWIAILTGRICLNVAKDRGAASTSKQASKKGGT